MWTRNFKADIECTLAPVWVTLLELPRHYHDWVALEHILEPIGPLIALDKVIIAQTRPTTTKTRVEIDLTRPRLKKIEVTLMENSGEVNVFNQVIEYETILEFCFHCRMQGHSEGNCRLQQITEIIPCQSDVDKTNLKENEKSKHEEGWT